jgi:hypothetical protein
VNKNKGNTEKKAKSYMWAAPLLPHRLNRSVINMIQMENKGKKY